MSCQLRDEYNAKFGENEARLKKQDFLEYGTTLCQESNYHCNCWYSPTINVTNNTFVFIDTPYYYFNDTENRIISQNIQDLHFIKLQDYLEFIDYRSNFPFNFSVNVFIYLMFNVGYLPLLLVCGSSILVNKFLRNKNEDFQNEMDETGGEAQNRTTRTSGNTVIHQQNLKRLQDELKVRFHVRMVIFCYMFCFTPLLLFKTIYLFLPKEILIQQNQNLKHLDMLVIAIYNLNTIIDPILYCTSGNLIENSGIFKLAVRLNFIYLPCNFMYFFRNLEEKVVTTKRERAAGRVRVPFIGYLMKKIMSTGTKIGIVDRPNSRTGSNKIANRKASTKKRNVVKKTSTGESRNSGKTIGSSVLTCTSNFESNQLDTPTVGNSPRQLDVIEKTDV